MQSYPITGIQCQKVVIEWLLLDTHVIAQVDCMINRPMKNQSWLKNFVKIIDANDDITFYKKKKQKLLNH